MTPNLDSDAVRQRLADMEARLIDRLNTGSEDLFEDTADLPRSSVETLYDRWQDVRTDDRRAELEDHLEQVRDALQRLEAGKYGLCTKCGAEINPERLSSLPTAQLCIRCQQNLERPVV